MAANYIYWVEPVNLAQLCPIGEIVQRPPAWASSDTVSMAQHGGSSFPVADLLIRPCQPRQVPWELTPFPSR